MVGHQPSSLDLYAEWKAYDLDRERREGEAREAGVEAPAESVDAANARPSGGVDQTSEAAPRPSQESTEPICICRDEAAGLYTSPTTGRRYRPQVTPTGIRYGLEPRTRFVHLEVRDHSIERGSAGWPVVDRFVTQIEAKLQLWTEAVEMAKAYTWRPQDRETLDALVRRWVRWPGSWKTTRRHILDVTSHVTFKPNTKRAAMASFQRRAFVESFEERGPCEPSSPENVPLIP